MGTRTVEPEPYEPVEFIGKKLTNVGDEFVGVFVSNAPGEYGEDYKFRPLIVDAPMAVLTLKGKAKDEIEKLALQFGDKTTIKIKNLINTGKQHPFKQFSYKAEDATEKSKAYASARPKPPPPPAEEAFEDDAPF